MRPSRPRACWMMAALGASLGAAPVRAGDLDRPRPQVQIQVRLAEVERTELGELGVDYRGVLGRFGRDDFAPGAGFFTLDPPSEDLTRPPLDSVLEFLGNDSILDYLGEAALPGAETAPRTEVGVGSPGVRFPDVGVPGEPRADYFLPGVPGSRTTLAGFPYDPSQWDPTALYWEPWQPGAGLGLLKASARKIDAKVLGIADFKLPADQPVMVDLSGRVPLPIPDGPTLQPESDYRFQLELTPSVAKDGRIGMTFEIRSTAADLGALPPADRIAAAGILIDPGQSIVIGGLIDPQDQDPAGAQPGLSRLPIVGRLFGGEAPRKPLPPDDSEASEGVPGLGSLPVLGQLFRSQRFQRGQTTLLIIVTPRVLREDGEEGGSVSAPTGGSQQPESKPGLPTVRPRPPDLRPQPDVHAPQVPQQPSYPTPRGRTPYRTP